MIGQRDGNGLPVESLRALTLAELMGRRQMLQAEVEALTAEARRRGVVLTKNLVGELGERLTADVLGGVLAVPGMKSIDLVDALGRRVQVKTRELPAGKLRHFQFGDSELDFDIAVCIRFDRATFRLEWARLFERAELLTLVSAHPSGPRLPGGRARDSGKDLTEPFRAAWARLQHAATP